MALRHRIPDGFVLGVNRLIEPARPPPVLKTPVRVGFRSGADFKDVFAAVTSSRVTEVEAAVGSGKSVALPSALAEYTSLPVIHVVPAHLLALDQSGYVKTVSPVGVGWVVHPTEEVARSGVTYMSSATAVARLLSDGKLSPFDAYVVLDESHESDAYTYVLRNVVPFTPFVRGVVKASATFSMSNFRTRETAGEVKMVKYQPQPVRDWDVFDETKPWSYTNLTGNTLVFVDSKRDAEDLVSKYNQLGFSAHRLWGQMSDESFLAAMNEMRDPQAPLVVLIADYTFRSGFTFDVNVVIDSGLVSYMDVSEGAPRRCWRKAYELELYQGAGRAGRLPGSVAVCYVPDGEVERAICDLEGVELDAAAVLMRMLGYAVPRQLGHSVFATGDVPKDLLHALRDAQPFACLTPEHLEPFVCDARRDSGVGLSTRSSIEQIRKVSAVEYETISYQEEHAGRVPLVAHVDSGGAYRQKVGNDVSGFVARKSVDEDPSTLGFWEDAFARLDLLVDANEVVKVEAGKFYYAEGVSDQPRRSRGLPKGMESLQAIMAEPNFLYRLKSMSSDDRMTAIACALDRYNGITAELVALSQIIREGPLSSVGAGVRADVRARWAVHASELVSAHISESMMIGSALPSMCKGVSALRLMTSGMPEVIDQFKEYHEAQIPYFGIGHARDVREEYKHELGRAERQLIGDTPARSEYVNQRGPGEAAGQAVYRHVRTSSNVGRSNAMNVLSWIGGVHIKKDTGGRNPKGLHGARQRGQIDYG